MCKSVWNNVPSALSELGEAEECQSEEGNLTWLELADILGVKHMGDSIPTVDFFNACLAVQDNAAVRALPKAERLRVIHTAIDVINAMNSRRF